MKMKTLHASHPGMIPGLSTEDLRDLYLVTDLFVPGEISLSYSHVERMVVGGASPVDAPVALDDGFLARREMGVINISKHAGTVTVDGETFELASREGLYIPSETASVSFASADAANPAKFYLASAPSHARHKAVKITLDMANPMPRGATETSNARVIYQYLDPKICKTSQLLLGLTELQAGSVWNTQPCHLHERRSETYFYFDVADDQRVFHFMGEPDETRHIVVANEQAVVSPPWSIHMGCGTSSYTFIWAMAGENQDYMDLDGVALADMK